MTDLKWLQSYDYNTVYQTVKEGSAFTQEPDQY